MDLDIYNKILYLVCFCICLYINTFIPISLFIHIYPFIYTFISVYNIHLSITQAHTFMNMHTHIHTFTNIHMHIYTHIETYIYAWDNEIQCVSLEFLSNKIHTYTFIHTVFHYTCLQEIAACCYRTFY